MEDFSTQLSPTLDHILASIPLFKPELTLTITFLATLFSSLFLDRRWKQASFSMSLLGIALTAFFIYRQLGLVETAFFGMLHIDELAVYSRLLMLGALFLIFILIQQYIKEKNVKKTGDIYSILLASALGMNLLTMSTNWLMLFIAIEIVSISSYILVGYFTESKKQSEATMKYVLFGSVSAAVMLYGLSLIYGFTGNLDFTSVTHLQGLIAAPKTLISIAILFVFVGIGFKLSFVPFHLWTPDVYEGAPTPITNFLSTVPKIGALILFTRLFQSWTSTLFYFSELTFLFITIVAIGTMLIGNLIALRQSNIKRMMAYSSIGHTGFLLMAVLTASSSDQHVLLFYLFVYTIMNIAVFTMIQLLEQSIGSTELTAYSGVGKKAPLLFTFFTILGVSLIGLPPTAGFIAKVLVFTSTFDLYQASRDTAVLLLLITGALTSVISLFYYFKIPLHAFLRKEEGDFKPIPLSPAYIIAVVLGLLTLVLGVFPDVLSGFVN